MAEGGDIVPAQGVFVRHTVHRLQGGGEEIGVGEVEIARWIRDRDTRDSVISVSPGSSARRWIAAPKE